MVLKNYIKTYNSDGGGTTPEKRQKEAYDFFVSRGYTPQQSAGIVGNLIQESGFDLRTHVKGFDGTGSTGIAQWLGSRLDNLKKVQGDKWDTFKGQLEFIDWELKNTEKRAAQKLLASETAEEAAFNFSKYYERPHKDYAHNEKRQRYASSISEKYNKPVVEKPTSKINIPTSELPRTTQDSLDPNYFIEDIFDDSQKEQPKEDLNQLIEMFKQESAKTKNEKEFTERLKTLSFESPQQTVQQVQPIDNMLSGLYSDELYNYIR